jgi:MFS superfamily sulfate permease-like transporter
MAASGAMLDATQEMITLGFCNIVGSFVRSMPINGSFTRSAVNNSSGVRTPFGGLYTGTDLHYLDITQVRDIHHVLSLPTNKGKNKKN